MLTSGGKEEAVMSSYGMLGIYQNLSRENFGLQFIMSYEKILKRREANFQGYGLKDGE